MDENLVQHLIEKGENLTLAQVVDSTRVCKMMCGLFRDPPGWQELLLPLKETIEEKYPGEVDWQVPYHLKKGDHAKEVVSEGIKEKYIRILLFSQGKG